MPERYMQPVKDNDTATMYEEAPTMRAVKLSLFALIFTLSLFGNSLVCLVVCRQQRLRTSTNYFILNLACADLAVTLFCIPFDIVVQENGYIWPFGDFLCRIMYPFMTLLTFASVGTLVAIALNRYEAISRPLRMNTFGKKRARLVICCVWAISTVLVLPYMAVLQLNEKSQCEETWSTEYRKLYTVFIFVFQYVLPLSVITAAYVRIGIHLRRNRANMAPAHRIQDRDVAKVVRMMIVVVLIFAICMLPNQILWLLKDFYFHTPAEDELLGWGAILIYANSCTNPIVYSICIEEFRVAFKAYIMKCHRVTDEDVVGVTKLFERLSFRGGSLRISQLRSRASHPNVGNARNFIQRPTEGNPLTSTELSPQKKKKLKTCTVSKNVEKKNAVVVTIV